jgi:hypothetical protein
MQLTQGVQRPDQGTSKQLSIRKGKAFELIKMLTKRPLNWVDLIYILVMIYIEVI